MKRRERASGTNGVYKKNVDRIWPNTNNTATVRHKYVLTRDGLLWVFSSCTVLEPLFLYHHWFIDNISFLHVQSLCFFSVKKIKIEVIIVCTKKIDFYIRAATYIYLNWSKSSILFSLLKKGFISEKWNVCLKKGINIKKKVNVYSVNVEIGLCWLQ